MNGKTEQFYLDYRTGRPTFISGQLLSQSDWKGCAKLNRTRASAIKETARESASSESSSIDVWDEFVVRKARNKEIPLIPFSRFGIRVDEDGFMSSRILSKCGEGKEASAWLDDVSLCVYKFFSLRHDGSLGQELRLNIDENELPSVTNIDATLFHILDKIVVLHEAGGCPTEIVGITDDGSYLVAKQPLCIGYDNLEEDRKTAARFLHAVVPTGTFGQHVWVFWESNRAWLLGDLHMGNIRRLADGTPTIIDALIGEISPSAIHRLPALSRAITRAKHWKETGNDDAIGGLTLRSDDDL